MGGGGDGERQPITTIGGGGVVCDGGGVAVDRLQHSLAAHARHLRYRLLATGVMGHRLRAQVCIGFLVSAHGLDNRPRLGIRDHQPVSHGLDNRPRLGILYATANPCLALAPPALTCVPRRPS